MKKKYVEYSQTIIKSVLVHLVARKNEFVLNLVDHGFIPFLSLTLLNLNFTFIYLFLTILFICIYIYI